MLDASNSFQLPEAGMLFSPLIVAKKIQKVVLWILEAGSLFHGQLRQRGDIVPLPDWEGVKY